MAHEALAAIEYRNDPPVCVYGSSDAARERMRGTAEGANCRVAEIVQGLVPEPDGVPAAAVLIEIGEEAPEDALVPLLDWAQGEAVQGTRGVLISTALDGLDLVFARAPDAEHLCGADELERRARVAAVSRRPLRLHDVRRDDGAAILQQLTEDVSRIAALLSSLSDEETAALVHPRLAEEGAGSAEPGIDSAQVRAIIRARRLREQFFRGGLFADPAWDMLLDLMAARLEGTRVAVSSLCIAAAVPATTALRWIKALTDRGLFVRSADPQDGRRVYIELSDDAARAMLAYLKQRQRIAGAGF